MKNTQRKSLAKTGALLAIGLFGSTLLAADEPKPPVADWGHRLAPTECNLNLTPPVLDWHEGLPLGNGELGGLVWGASNSLTVKLDRLDLWDERCQEHVTAPEFKWKTIQRLVAEKKFDELAKMTDSGQYQFNRPPTHIAVGKLLLTLSSSVRASLFTLDLANAEGRIAFAGQTASPARMIASATESVILLRLPEVPEKLEFWAPGVSPKWFSRLGYPAPSMGREGDALWYEQSIPASTPETTYGFDGVKTLPAWKFVVYAESRKVGTETVIAMTIASNRKDNADPLGVAKERVARVFKQGIEPVWKAHQQHWANFWQQSELRIPDATAMRHYYLTRYYLGASCKPGFPAMGALQSVWTDNRMIPAYFNDFHNDLETQVQYQSYQTAGHFAEGRTLFEYLWEMLPTSRGYAKKIFETGGAAVPGVMTYGGNPISGVGYWPQYNMSPTYAGWFGWLFYQHWRYTQDREFLATRAYPWCTEIAECWSQLLKPDADGTLKLPLSSSSEIFDDSARAWLTPNSNQDIHMMRAHLLGLAEMADALGKGPEAGRWRGIADKLGPKPGHVDEEGALMWSANEKVLQHHRHLSHAMCIQPFNLLTMDGDERDRAVIAATMKRFDRTGVTGCPWSMVWRSSMLSRVGESEKAYRYLDMFLQDYITRNGFHMNRKLKGIANAKDCLFTIEANMLANQAVHDMLIQSWAPTIGQGEAGVVRLFPATPWLWHEASFTDLRAEGGFRVSAKREKNATIWFKIAADADGLLRLRDNFGGRAPKWSGREMTKVGVNFERPMRKGEVIEATLETPAEIPPKPAKSYAPANAANGSGQSK